MEEWAAPLWSRFLAPRRTCLSSSIWRQWCAEHGGWAPDPGEEAVAKSAARFWGKSRLLPHRPSFSACTSGERGKQLCCYTYYGWSLDPWRHWCSGAIHESNWEVGNPSGQRHHCSLCHAAGLQQPPRRTCVTLPKESGPTIGWRWRLCRARQFCWQAQTALSYSN